MAKRVAHMQKLRVKTDEFVTAGVTSTHWFTEYWCGKTAQTIEDDGPLTTGEQRMVDKFKEREAKDPAPVCQKCERRKYPNGRPATVEETRLELP